MTRPLNPRDMVTIQEIAISNMLEIKEELMAKIEMLDGEMKEKWTKYIFFPQIFHWENLF
jgi:hypothetical protein